MTNRYWKNPTGKRYELSEKEMKEITARLRKEGKNPIEIRTELIRVEQRQIRAMLSTQTPYCSLTDEPCISPQGFCTQCPIETGETSRWMK